MLYSKQLSHNVPPSHSPALELRHLGSARNNNALL